MRHSRIDTVLTSEEQAALAGGRVVFVLPTLEGGGAERVTLAFLAGLAPLCPDLHLVLFRRSGLLIDRIPYGVEVHELGGLRLLTILPALVATLRRLQPHVIYSTHGYANIALLALRPFYGSAVRLVLREANIPSRSLAAQKFTVFFRTAYRLLYPHAEALICQSRQMLCELQRDFTIPSRRLYLIYNPTDIESIRLGLIPVRAPGPGARLVAAGMFSHKKGFDRLLDWFYKLPATSHLTLLGKGPHENELREKAQRLGLGNRVTVVGFVPSPWGYFAGADAFLLPSRWEGMPNVALEALACGTRVIATPDGGGIVEVAHMATSSAVTLAAPGEEFIAAMAAVRPDPVLRIRPSLLPQPFELSRGQGCFNVLLASVVAGREA